MSRELERQLEALQQGDHLCLIYEDATEQMAAIVPFIRQGLSRGERCGYIVDDRTADEVVAALAAGGVDVARERERGALLLLTKRDSYLRSGHFDPESMIALLRQTVAEALSAGFTGLRVTGEMTWALGPEIGCDRLIEYEALLNDFFPGSRALAICQYNRQRFLPAIILDILRTHPVAILGDEVCPNLYYEPPQMVLTQEPNTEKIDWMIGQLRRAREAEEELRTRAQQRAVLSRLAQQALVTADLHALMHEAVAMIAQVLSVEYSNVLEMLPDGNALLLRAGVGWTEGLVGEATVGTGTGSQAGYALLCDAPVIVEDLRTETRFSGPPLLHDHGVISGMSVAIPGGDRPYGVIGAYTGRRRAFTRDDVLFLETVAAILAATIERRRADDEIRQLNRDLERRVVERTVQVEAANRELQAEIAERRLAEDALRETRDYLEKLFDHANAPIIVWDPAFRVTRFNHAFEHLTAYTADEMLGRALSTLFPETSRDESLAEIARTLSGENWESVEIPIRRKDGDVRVALWNSANVYAEDGTTLIATIAQGQDITERKRAEEALRASEEKYRSLVDGARDYAIFMLDPEGRVISWSPGAERILGYRVEEIVGQHFSRFYTHEDLDQGRPKRELAMAAAGGRIEDEGWRVRKDGSRYWANAIVTALHDGEGKLRGFSKLIRDMTERRQVEEQLRKLSRAVEQSPATVVITDTSGNIEYVNPRFVDTTGYTSEEALGKNPRILKSGHLPAEEYERLWKTVTAGGEWRGEFHNRRKNGELYWEAASISPIRSPEGTITHFLAVKEEITERKQAEEAIRKLNADLIRQARELRAINAELEAFSYSVSHDLRAPLRSIDGFSLALLEDYGDLLDDQGKHYLRRVRAGSQRMGQLIDDMLTLSRVTRAEMRRELVDLSLLAQDIVQEMQGKQPERRVEFVAAPGLAAYGDGRLLRVVLENLLGNAWKFTEKHPTARIEFGSTRIEGQAAYFVRDGGAGFDMAYVGKLFGAFQRLHGQNEFAGTGIGLATVQRIIRRHGGRVWAEGQVDRGATFYFTL